ncbi:Rv1733c family protein [Streptomyces sp. NPDC001340]
MNGNRRTKKMLWRWRNNPLRRHGDIVEAWVVLAIWAVVAVGGTVVGLLTAHSAGEEFTRQRLERQPVHAVLLTDVPRKPTGSWTTIDKISTRVRWTAPEGSVHTDKALVNTGLKAGSRVLVWTDDRGQVVTEPPSPSEAAVEAGLLATGAVLGFAGLALGVGGLARWKLEQQRIEQWDREWELVGPQWGHKTG